MKILNEIETWFKRLKTYKVYAKTVKMPKSDEMLYLQLPENTSVETMKDFKHQWMKAMDKNSKPTVLCGNVNIEFEIKKKKKKKYGLNYL